MIRRIIKNHYITELIPKRHEYLKCFLDIVFERQGQMASLAIFYQTFLNLKKQVHLHSHFMRPHYLNIQIHTDITLFFEKSSKNY